ncbi:unnamed protein product [Rotaria sordida]|uniref:Uncharacterized protein n=1 Tax=Rotaria sordida TaxID=392033 RepID=A0A815SGA1_9BILA|nr:unnamed protein product [Rotaria sordida]
MFLVVLSSDSETSNDENENMTMQSTSINTEGEIISDKGVSITKSEINEAILRRRSFKVQDETGIINIIIWNNKNEEIPENVINKHIRIRNGRVNVYNGSINASNNRNFIRAFDEFNTFASSFSLYRTDKAAYYRSVLNTLWNGPSCYFRQLVKGDVKCENPWLSIVAAAHPVTIINILKEENNQLGGDGLFARFVFSARISPEDVHKRRKRAADSIAEEYPGQSCSVVHGRIPTNYGG